MPLIPATREAEQEDHEFEASQGNIVRAPTQQKKQVFRRLNMKNVSITKCIIIMSKLHYFAYIELNY